MPIAQSTGAFRGPWTWGQTAGPVDLSHPLASGLLFAWAADRGYMADVGPHGRLYGTPMFVLGPAGLSIDATAVDTGFVSLAGNGTALRVPFPLTMMVVMVVVGQASRQYHGFGGLLHNTSDINPWVVISLSVGSDYRYTVDGNAGGTHFQYQQWSAPWSDVYAVPSTSVIAVTPSSVRAWRNSVDMVTQSASSSDPTYGSQAAAYVGYQIGVSNAYPNARISALCVWNRRLADDEIHGLSLQPLALFSG